MVSLQIYRLRLIGLDFPELPPDEERPPLETDFPEEPPLLIAGLPELPEFLEGVLAGV